MIEFHTLFLQSAANDQLISFVMIGAMIGVFYFFMIRPQAQKQKQQTAFQNSIEKGKEVVTASGMLGKVNKIEDDIITLEVGNKVYIRVTRNAISKELTDAVFAADSSDKK